MLPKYQTLFLVMTLGNDIATGFTCESIVPILYLDENEVFISFFFKLKQDMYISLKFNRCFIKTYSIGR